jgi:hypothetical protein
MHAKQENMYQYLLRTYEEICQRDDDDQNKIKDLKILLEESEKYYEGLPSTPDPARHICWLMCWSIIAYNNCISKGFIFYLSSFAATYKAVQLLDDMSRHGQKDKIRERYARLESLMAGIQARLDQSK